MPSINLGEINREVVYAPSRYTRKKIDKTEILPPDTLDDVEVTDEYKKILALVQGKPPANGVLTTYFARIIL